MATQVGSTTDEASTPQLNTALILGSTFEKEKTEYQQPQRTREYALQALQELGFSKPEVKQFTSKIGIRGYAAIANFKLACEMMGVPFVWGEEQVKAFLIYINFKYYSTSYLNRMWSCINKLGTWLDCPITDEQEADFELVLNGGKELKDNKVPVSRELLRQLCEAADSVFNDYNATLAKVLFLTAWGGYMRVSEYSRTSAKEGNKHNIRSNAVLTSTAGISITFHSDKTSRGSNPMKHRFIAWKRLPKLAKQAFTDYKALRPKQAYNFFCREDGAELTRSYVLNLLETCLLLTDYRNMSVSPHCFRLGAASHDRLQGVPMREIEDRGRWGPKSKAIEAYTHQDLVVLHPSTLWEERPVYRKYWPHQRLVFITKSVVEKHHDGTHPFRDMLEKWYPELIEAFGSDIPTVFPDDDAIRRMREIQENKASGKFLKKFAAAEAKRQKDCTSRTQTASKFRRAAQRRIKGAVLPWSYLNHAKIKLGVNDNKLVQTDPLPSKEMSTQTDEVITFSPEEFKKLQISPPPVANAEHLPDRLPLSDSLRHIKSEEPLFRVRSLGADLALTKKQIKERRRTDPLIQVARISMSAKQRFHLRCRIRRRVSKRYRDHKNNSRARYIERVKGIPVRKATRHFEKTSSINRLVEFFVAEVMEHGRAGMPTWIEEQDPPYSDDEFEERVKTLYKNKPPQYEQLLAIKLHATQKGKKKFPRAQARAPTPSPPVNQFPDSESSTSDEESHAQRAQHRTTRSISSLIKQYHLKEAQVLVTPVQQKKKLGLFFPSATASPEVQPSISSSPLTWKFEVKNTPPMSPDLFSLESTPAVVVQETPPQEPPGATLVRKVSRKKRARTVRIQVPNDKEDRSTYERVLAEHNLQLVDSLCNSQENRINSGDIKREQEASLFFPFQ